MFKQASLALALLVPAICFGSVYQAPYIEDAKVDHSYTCTKYTDNVVDGQNGFVTDNPVVELETTITQTKYMFTVEKNILFTDELKLSIPVGGAITGVSGNAIDMMFKKVGPNGNLYFLIYMGDRSNGPTWPINRGIVLAGCSKG